MSCNATPVHCGGLLVTTRRRDTRNGCPFGVEEAGTDEARTVSTVDVTADAGNIRANVEPRSKLLTPAASHTPLNPSRVSQSVTCNTETRAKSMAPRSSVIQSADFAL